LAFGFADNILLCIFSIFTLGICIRFPIRIGIIISIINGLAEISINMLVFSIPFFSLSNLAIIASLSIIGTLGSLLGSKNRLLQQSIEKQKSILFKTEKDYNYYKDLYDDSIQIISKDRFYEKLWIKLRNSNSNVKKLIWLIIYQILDCNDNFEKSVKTILSIDPRIFAITNQSGSIIAFNDTLMALYGYNSKDKILGTNIVDLIHLKDSEKAHRFISDSSNIGLTYKPQMQQRFHVKPKGGRQIPDVTLPTISFEFIGNDFLMIAFLNVDLTCSLKNEGFALQVIKNGLWCIDHEYRTSFISDSIAQQVGYEPNEMIGKEISHILNTKDHDEFRNIFREIADRETEFLSIDLLHKSGNFVYVQLKINAIKTQSGELVGLSATLDGSNNKRIKETLMHRLSMEEMIADISTKFVAIASNEIDQEIENALNRIEDFVGIKDSFLQLSLTQTNHTSSESAFITKSWHSSKPAKEFSNQGSSDNRREEILTIPLTSGGKSIGFFRCTQNEYAPDWVADDVRLVRLAGEIFINALESKEKELKLQFSEERLRITLHSIGDAVVSVDNDDQITMLNKAAEDLIGIQKMEAIGKPLDEIFIIEQVQDDSERLIESVNISLKCLNGNERFITYNRSHIMDSENNVYGSVIIFSDITEKKLKDDKIRYISFHDKLTTLYNRVFFEEEMHRLDVKRQYPITIIMGDCNGLKLTNDIFGHLEGDKLLKQIAQILLMTTRKEDIVARWGGDEFVIILPRTDEITAAIIIDRILKECNEAKSDLIKPSISLGYATKTNDFQTIEHILREAEDRMYRHKLLEGKSARNAIISSFEKMLFERNYETEEHAKRMQELSLALGSKIGLSEHDMDNLSLLATLHDIGKIGIPDELLLKPGPLTNNEWAQMKKHPEKGFSIAESTNELKNIAKLILHHHERWDGKGYPDGLKGEQIPLLSRILSIVDAYDVITHARPYKEPLSHEDAMDEIRNCAGTQFDPSQVDAFVELMSTYRVQ